MLVPVCDGSISTSLGSVQCSGQWTSVELSSITGFWSAAPTIEQYEALISACIGVFALAFVVKIVLNLLLNR